MSSKHTAAETTAGAPHPTDGLPGGLPWEPRSDDLGLQIVDTIGHCLTLDAEWSVRDERGFTWWGKDLAQRVWSEPGFDDDGFEIFRLHAQTDLLAGFDPSHENLATLNAFAGLATTSGYLVDEETGTVRLAASMYAHAETEDWARRTFQLVVAMQAAHAHLEASVLAELTGATVAGSVHPISGHGRLPTRCSAYSSSSRAEVMRRRPGKERSSSGRPRLCRAAVTPSSPPETAPDSAPSSRSRAGRHS